MVAGQNKNGKLVKKSVAVKKKKATKSVFSGKKSQKGISSGVLRKKKTESADSASSKASPVAKPVKPPKTPVTLSGKRTSKTATRSDSINENTIVDKGKRTDSVSIRGVMEPPPSSPNSNGSLKHNAPEMEMVKEFVKGDEVSSASLSTVSKKPSSDTTVKWEVESFREQVQNYLEICDSISGVSWEPVEIIDLLHILVESLNFDTVAMLAIDPIKTDRFEHLVSRGYSSPPSAEVIKLWEEAIVPSVPTIDWGRLMTIAGDTTTPLAQWIVDEKLHQFGYVPMHDGGKIFGFIIIASYEKKKVSPFASQILELCGGRLGLSFSLNINMNAVTRVLETQEYPTSSLVFNEAVINDIKDKFKLLSGQMALIGDLSGSSACSEEIKKLLLNCNKFIKEGVSKLDFFLK